MCNDFMKDFCEVVIDVGDRIFKIMDKFDFELMDIYEGLKKEFISIKN